jgi:6-phosphogluconolactonase (cycloisomerase 2 family)
MGSKVLKGSLWSLGAATLVGMSLSGCGHSISVSGGPPAPPPPAGPEFVYVSNTGDDTVSLLSVDKKTGGLTNVNQTIVEVGSGLKGIAATKKFLFAADPTTSEIFGFSINTTNGNLTPTAQGMLNTGVGTAPTAMSIPAGSNSLYVTDFANNQLLQYSFDTGTGALTAIGSPVATDAGPVSVAASNLGTAVFVANKTTGTITGYTRNTNNGALTPSGSIVSLGTSAGSPNWIAADLSGGLLYSADAFGGLGGSIVVFTISGASLTLNGAFGTGNLAGQPLSVAINQALPFVYSANDGNDNASQYTIQSGGLSPALLIQDIPSANSVISDVLGHFVYVTDNALTDGLIFQFTLDTTTSTLSPISPGSVSTENPPNPTSNPFQIICIQEPAPS